MHFREVALKLKAAQKIFAANFALELGGVGSAVRDQGRGLGEPFTTLRTYVRFLLCMCSFVSIQVRNVTKRFVAHIALI